MFLVTPSIPQEYFLTCLQIYVLLSFFSNNTKKLNGEKNLKVKVLGKSEIQKLKMGSFYLYLGLSYRTKIFNNGISSLKK